MVGSVGAVGIVSNMQLNTNTNTPKIQNAIKVNNLELGGTSSMVDSIISSTPSSTINTDEIQKVVDNGVSAIKAATDSAVSAIKAAQVQAPSSQAPSSQANNTAVQQASSTKQDLPTYASSQQTNGAISVQEFTTQANIPTQIK